MYAIATSDFDEYGMEAIAFWVTRFISTDNYTYNSWEATRFASKSAAKALMKTFDLERDHTIIEV